MIPVEHKPFVEGSPAFAGDEQAWVDRMLNEGIHAPAAELPGCQWYMPGSIVKQDPFDLRTGPAGIPDGERPYMIVAEGPSFGDHNSRRVLASDVGKILKSALEDAGLDTADVYFTTIVKFPKPLNASTYKACWTKPGWSYFLEEFKRVNPRAVLFLGSAAAKIAFGQKATLQTCRGQILNFHGKRATVATSHLNFVSNTAGLPVLVKELAFFRKMGYDPDVAPHDGMTYLDRNYEVLDTKAKIKNAVRRVVDDPTITRISFDIESGNDTGRPEHDYVITFQWSDGPKRGKVIPLYVERKERMVPELHTSGKQKGEKVLDENGNVVMVPEYGGSGVSHKCEGDKVEHYDYAVKYIRKLFACRRLTWIGHGLREDLKWCRDSFGIDPRPLVREGRIWDTMLACHLLVKDEYGLKQQVLRHTDMGAYDAPMHQWVNDNAGGGKLFPGAAEDRFFHAYRDIAFKYLLPYALCDVDATYRIYLQLREELHSPENDALRLLFCEVEMPVQSGIMDIETYGIPAEADRLEELTDIYTGRQKELVKDIREACRWPTLNPGSSKQLSAMIYAGPFKEHEKHKGRMPEGALCLGLTPLLTTGKYPKKWQEVCELGHEEYESPSTAHDTVVTLLATYDMPEESRKILDLVRQYAAMKIFISLFLKEPKFTKLTGNVYSLYGKGLRSCIDTRGRIRCRISQLSETGRWRHSQPNLAQLPKKKEKAVAELFDEEDFKVPKIRSAFKAEPGWVIMEADWKSAEMFVMGYFSGDPVFIKVLESGTDIHGANAVNVFGLDCHANEVSDKYPDKRSAVKAIGFGIAYGLSVKGLSERLSVELKRVVTVEEAQKFLDQFFNTYPKLRDFFEQRKADVEKLGYVCTMYGRRRYFPGVSQLGREKLAAAKREAMNAPIQGTVADMLNVALINLDRMRYDTEVGQQIGWEVMVGIHDALLVHVPEQHAPTMAKILKYCMKDAVPLPGTDNVTIPVDIEGGERWGEFDKIAA